MKTKKNNVLSQGIEPQEDSQEAIVLKHLKRGWKISNAVAVAKYQIYRLGAVIDRLRDKYWPIQTIDRKKATRKGTYGEYKMAK